MTEHAQSKGPAAQYPARPVRMILPFPAGGPTDILGRLLAQKLTEAWRQNVIVDNRPGEINYASSGESGSGHLAGELFKAEQAKWGRVVRDANIRVE